MAIDRRTFTQASLGSLLTYSLLESIAATDAFGKEVRLTGKKWLAGMHAKCHDLRGKKISQVEWQRDVEELISQVDLRDLLSLIDFAKLTKGLKFRDKGERAFRARFPEVEGLPTKLVFGHQMFGLKQNQSVVPHGHNNMATSFLILKGEFHGRHYDRLEDAKEHMIIKPTINDKFSAGEYSSISDHKDNVHWFKALSKTAFIFNIHVLNVDPTVKRGGRVYVDPNGEKLAGGKIKAAKISSKAAHQKYG